MAAVSTRSATAREPITSTPHGTVATDPLVLLIQRVFPGAVEVSRHDTGANAPSTPDGGSGGPDTHGTPSEALHGARRARSAPNPKVVELIDAVEAMVGWFGDNEPARLDRPGWQRIVAAVAGVKGSAAALADPSADRVQLRAAAGQTEKAAAAVAFPHSGTQRMAVLDAIDNALDGCTDDELADLTGLSLNAVRPRRGELVDGGWIEDTGKLRDSAAGNPAIVWGLTQAAEHEYAMALGDTG